MEKNFSFLFRNTRYVECGLVWTVDVDPFRQHEVNIYFCDVLKIRVNRSGKFQVRMNYAFYYNGLEVSIKSRCYENAVKI